MEQIVAADAMKAEMLEDARKKAEHIVKEAEEGASRELEAARALSSSSSEEIARQSAARVARLKAESEARLPLEMMRARTEAVDRALREAMRSFLASLPADEAARVAAAMLARGACLLEGTRPRVARRGLPLSAAESAASALGSGAAAEAEEDLSLAATGLAASDESGKARMLATMDLLEELLLDRRRAELARALCAEALALGAGSDSSGGGA